jgi:hypothetical protein
LRKWIVAAILIVAAGVGVWLAGISISSPAQTSSSGPGSAIYTSSHASLSEAARHFLGIRSEPLQPIAFVHSGHMQTAELSCTDCHYMAARGPLAAIPDIRACWTCHQTVTDHSELRKLKQYYEKGQDIPWQRVWGWSEDAHVRFNHAPHVRAEIQCETCHGNVAEMTVATRVFEHTMGFCLDCHRQRNVSIDCVTCHY